MHSGGPRLRIVVAGSGERAGYPRWLPALLRLPDFLFIRLAQQMLSMDARARSSMSEDLQAGRVTEVDHLNGPIVELAQSLGREAPLNRRICTLIHEAQQHGVSGMRGQRLLELVQRNRPQCPLATAPAIRVHPRFTPGCNASNMVLCFPARLCNERR